MIQDDNHLLLEAVKAYYWYVATDEGSPAERLARNEFEFAFATLMCDEIPDAELMAIKEDTEARCLIEGSL